MNTLTTEQKIKRMESELAELKKQQAAEIKAAQEAEAEKQKQELDSIKRDIEIFNTKYGTEYDLTTRSSLMLFHTLCW